MYTGSNDMIRYFRSRFYRWRQESKVRICERPQVHLWPSLTMVHCDQIFMHGIYLKQLRSFETNMKTYRNCLIAETFHSSVCFPYICRVVSDMRLWNESLEYIQATFSSVCSKLVGAWVCVAKTVTTSIFFLRGTHTRGLVHVRSLSLTRSPSIVNQSIKPSYCQTSVYTCQRAN